MTAAYGVIYWPTGEPELDNDGAPLRFENELSAHVWIAYAGQKDECVVREVEAEEVGV